MVKCPKCNDGELVVHSDSDDTGNHWTWYQCSNCEEKFSILEIKK